jgi:transglutaminase-like putative cysteine protease
MEAYLKPCPVIDFTHSSVAAKAAGLRVQDAAGVVDAMATTQRCFAFVRDEIAHSGDIRSDHVTLKASDVLAVRTGWCFAKSHLLAALLRANGIPAALCYQRLQKDGEGSYTLHGLNAVYLPDHGWYRCDARGNKPGVDAQFTPPVERLAWPAFDAGEFDFSGRYAEPIPHVVRCLTQSMSYADVFANLPDALTLEAVP